MASRPQPGPGRHLRTPPPDAGGREAGQPDVTVAIVTHDSEAVLDGCLQSLPAALGHLSARVVVVDSGSQAPPTTAVARHPGAELLDLGANRGYAAGINAAWSVAPARSLLVLNPDVALDPGAAEELMAGLDTPGTGITVPRLVDGAGAALRSLRREPTLARALGEALLGGSRAGRVPALGEVVTAARSYREPTPADWATGAAMLVSRACLEAVGPWDDSFFLYSEETEFCLRARDAGFRLRLAPGARAVHAGGEAHTSPALWALLSGNRLRLYRARHGPVAGAAYRLVLVLGSALRAGRGRHHRAALAALLRPAQR